MINTLPHIMSITYLKLIILFLAFTTSLMTYAQRRAVSCRVTTSTGQEMSLSAYLFEEVDEQPTYPGGEQEMIKFINHERRYPQPAYDSGLQGRVLCSFIVKADGTISYVEVLRGVEKSLNDEAVRVIENMPRWNPGKVDGISVPTYCILPISFRK